MGSPLYGSALCLVKFVDARIQNQSASHRPSAAALYLSGIIFIGYNSGVEC